MMSKEIWNHPMMKEIWEWIEAVIVAVILVLILRLFVIQNTKVLGHSMDPTLNHNDAVIVNKLVYRIREPKRGEIIVFPYKEDPTKDYIKRVIGLPGDSVDIIENEVYINGEKLVEPYILEQMERRGDIAFPFIVPEDTYFVMGDNRNNSSDSRYSDVGAIPRSKMIGQAALRIWPLEKFGLLN